MGRIDVAAAGASLTVSETEVFNGTSPTSWTDLNLSSTVGSQSTLVLLKIRDGSSGSTIAVRKNGDTDVFYNTSIPQGSGYGVAAFTSLSTLLAVLLVATDSAGKIEWRTEVARTITIDIIAYIK